MSTRVKLKIQGLANSQVQSGAYALILVEESGSRRIPIIVGTIEAQSIAIALEHLVPPRPLTHDLFVSFTKAVGATLKEVFIYKFEEGVFYSELIFTQGEETLKIDSRTSDAIAIALRLHCDVYTSEEIVKECGILLEDANNKSEKTLDDELLELEPSQISNKNLLNRWLKLQSTEKIEERLNNAIFNEDYEYAKMYKDELNLRKEEDSNNA